jgi:hypothetical protein
MKRSNKKLTKLQRENTLDWSQFNLLENILIFCIQQDLTVPKESGIRFRIALGSETKSLCLLFKIDRKDDPLFSETTPRPDYMALCMNADCCICTIIEMKGTAGLSHGVTQLKTFREILRQEIQEHLPSRFRSRIYIQGILLAPFNSQIPNKQIAREASLGFRIVPLLYHHTAELFPYVCRKLSLTDKYKHQTLRDMRSRTYLEDVLIKQAMPHRIHDSMYTARSSNRGLYINYLLSNEEYCVLSTRGKQFLFGIKETTDVFRKKFEAELADIGLTGSHDYSVEAIISKT